MSSSSINLSSYLNGFGSQSFNDELNLKRPQIELINQADAGLRKIDESFSLLEKQPANAQILEMIASHQQQLILSIVGNINSEFAIAQMLAQGIESLGHQLEVLQGWTNGGLGMFENAMAEIFEAMKANGANSGYALEDLFQLAIMDFMSHGYGSDMDAIMRHFLESTGSGSHGYHEHWDGNKFSTNCKNLFEYMMQNAPEGSLCQSILNYMNNDCGGVDSLIDQFKNNFNEQGGFVCDTDYSDENGLSPMLRLALMSAYLSEHPNVEQSTIILFLTGSIGELNNFVTENTNFAGAMDFLFKNDGYQDDPANDGWRAVSQGGHMVIDWEGTGLGADYFKEIYSKFPPRELTDEEVKEVQNISDQIKMMQETLKYWLSVIRDGQLSIARNI
ncbi:hypothetical protein BS333_08555 [Vibrio azureus]|uniref:Uncharacterized protein n=1 Tax=Vibrio azureus NBRC 104587 TaxID=1219077 RepID=U3C850_9VIBR|nr:hypothetical protein [Vibrio azureus]AUI86434.1 hypothetical protein BS333_08555 [Vibrio azureus]GAD77559.1 hypothetical protein VAZ01S_080_00090 [Vibrio azureus NBRC 104587]